MSGLYGGWGNTSHSYLLGKSVTTFPRSESTLSCKISGPSPVFGHFSAQFLQPVKIIHCCHTCSTWNSIWHDDSSVTISEDYHLVDLRLRSSKFFLSRVEFGLVHSFNCDFNSGSKSLTHVLSIAAIRYRNAWPSSLNFFNKKIYCPEILQTQYIDNHTIVPATNLHEAFT
jgi:hypothetical protein